MTGHWFLWSIYTIDFLYINQLYFFYIYFQGLILDVSVSAYWCEIELKQYQRLKGRCVKSVQSVQKIFQKITPKIDQKLPQKVSQKSYQKSTPKLPPKRP